MAAKVYVTEPTRVLVQQWDDAAVVYDQASGDTHLISLLAAELLLECQQSGRTQGELVLTIAELLNRNEQGQAEAAVAEALAALSRLGLIESLSQ